MEETKKSLINTFEDGEAVSMTAKYNTGLARPLYETAGTVFTLPSVETLLAGRESVENWVEEVRRRETAAHYPPMVPSVFVQLGRVSDARQLYKITTPTSGREVTVVVEHGAVAFCEIYFGGSRVAASKILNRLADRVSEERLGGLDIKFENLEPEGREWTIVLPRSLAYCEERYEIYQNLRKIKIDINFDFDKEIPPNSAGWEDVINSSTPVFEWVGNNEYWPSEGEGARWVREQALAVAKEVSPNATITPN